MPEQIVAASVQGGSPPGESASIAPSAGSADGQDVVLELGVFAKADGLVSLLRSLVIAAGRHAHTHGVGFLGHLLGGLDQVVGDQLATGFFGDEDVVENPYAFERKRRKARIKLAKAE
ncbi:hypothetical protein D3C76_1392460 [compost metagenome]